MKKVTSTLFLLLTAIASLTLLACDGGGGGGGQNGETTTINGRILNVIAMTESGDKSIKFAELIEMLNFIKEAEAQGEITVIAVIDGVEVDTTITDADGSFTLSFLLENAENVTLFFEIGDTTVSITIQVQEGSIIDIVIIIDLNAPPGDEVEIVDEDEVEGPISCETGTVEIFKGDDDDDEDENDDLVIDGGGEDCIRTAGNCNLIIDPENIVLTNCEDCIDARGTSQVTLTAPEGHILCDAFEDGIRSRGNASVNLDAFGDIDILAGGNGAQAAGNSVISFTANACIFDSGEEPLVEIGNAAIDTSGCGEIIEGPHPTPGPDL